MISPRRQDTDRLPSREHLVQKAKERLLRHGLPRLQMSLLVAMTGAAGFLTSFGLLKGGVDSMALRYPVAVGVAYGIFLLLLRIWLKMQEKSWSDIVDLPDGNAVELALEGVQGLGRGLGQGVGRGFSGGGGSFGGGGSSTSFEAPVSPLVASTPPPAPAIVRSSGGSSGGGKGFSFDFDLDDSAFLVVIAVVLVALAALGAAVWVIWSAPVLLAEVLVDGLIMTALYRRLRQREEPTHWLLSAIRRTWIPALVVAILFSFAGYLLQKAVPEAKSIGPAVRAVTGGDGAQ